MNTNNIVNKGLLLHGIGAGVLETVTGKVLEVTTGQSMKMDITATTEDVYGGDGLFPLYTYISKKEGSIQIEGAEFSLSQLNIAQETSVTTTGNKRTYRVLVTKTSTKLTDLTLTGVEIISMIAPDGQKVDVVDTADEDAIAIASDGTITVGANVTMQDGEYAVWFKADSTNTVSASMLKNAMPEVASFNWMLKTEDSSGSHYQIDIYARRTRCDGKFSIETARDKASVPQLTVNILDPGDGHDDFAVITITKLD